MREFIDWATAIVRRALDAGCTFFAGYPITPASRVCAHGSDADTRCAGAGERRWARHSMRAAAAGPFEEEYRRAIEAGATLAATA